MLTSFLRLLCCYIYQFLMHQFVGGSVILNSFGGTISGVSLISGGSGLVVLGSFQIVALAQVTFITIDSLQVLEWFGSSLLSLSFSSLPASFLNLTRPAMYLKRFSATDYEDGWPEAADQGLPNCLQHQLSRHLRVSHRGRRS
jgi:hypothetical protein